MAKLTKQEVNAIAGKLHRDLEEKVRLERLRAIHEYIPSPKYLEFQNNLQKIKEINNQREALNEEKNRLGRELNQILDELGIPKTYWNWWDSACEPHDAKLEEIVKAETKVPKVPSIEELKDDITIAAIDSDFNVDEYLKSQLEKW